MITARIKRPLVICTQVALLWMVSWLGHEAVRMLDIPLPGSVVGILLMFALLQAGIVPMAAVAQGADLLLRHLALFFIPIAAGMIAFGTLWLSSGAAILADLLASAAVGFAVTGLLCQALARVPRPEPRATEQLAEGERESA